MNHLIEAVRRSVQNENWYSALTTALILPDVAGHLDERSGRSKARYVAWYNDYLLHNYTSSIGAHKTPFVFLSGEDCYALRCVFLHEGEFDVSGRRARDVLDRFHFVVSRPGFLCHCVQGRGNLILETAVFCEDICIAVEEWLQARGSHPAVASGLAQLPKIHLDYDGGPAVSF